MAHNDSWSLEGPFLTLDDPVSELTKLKPYKLTEDKKGHDTAVHFRVPKNLTREAAKVKEQGPYETNSDVFRDAYWLGLKILKLRYTEDPRWISYSQIVEIVNDAKWDAEIHEQEKEFADTLTIFCQDRKKDKALSYLSKRWTTIDDERKEALLGELKSHGLNSLLDEM